MPPHRAMSYEEDGEHVLHPTRSNHQHQYYDPPMREVISPPPQYTSPAPPEPPSPVSLSHSRSHRTDISREQSPHRYTDESSSPPPPQPPTHRTSPSRYTRRNSGGRSISGAPIPLENISLYTQDSQPRSQAPSERLYTSGGMDRPTPLPGFPQPSHYQNSSSPIPGPYGHRPNSYLHEQSSYGSNIPLAAGAGTPGSITPTAASDWRSSRYSGRSIPLDEYYSQHPGRSSRQSYHDSPYHNSSHNVDATVSNASINPQNIADDGDDDFMPLPKHQGRPIKPAATAAVAPVGAASGVLGGIFGRKAKQQTASGSYRSVDNGAEKSEWLSRENTKRKRNGWLCGIGIGVVIVVVIIAGIVGGVVGTRAYKTGGNGNINNAADDTAANGDLNINSAEIKALMNNPNLHKVFPGMDYTPWGVQYPLCETYPPSQNNVTRDMAVLSQLTNTVRLYGTDCNQTEMVLHAIDRLNLKSMKIWLGVWIDTNQTTTDRQLAKMYTILNSVSDKSIFKGAIVGNEALYRAGVDKASSKAQLIQILKDVRSNFTTLGYDMPIATSDLGDNWDSSLVAVVDYVMSNIHPFFAGVTASSAAQWTMAFWNRVDIPLTASLPKVKQLISETGWPSGGGTDCGGTDGTCASGQSGATASVSGMNTYMNDWVCQALANGTEYFWFEAFDEPWKVQFNTPGKEWEDKWGLMDAGRNLKSGVKIPSCGGKTVS